MPRLFTPPFPIVGAGVVAAEIVLAGAILVVDWRSAPSDFAGIGAVLFGLLLSYWYMVGTFGDKVLRLPDGKPSDLAHLALGFGAAIGLAGMVLAFAAGPHGGATIALLALGLQHSGLAIARLKHAT